MREIDELIKTVEAIDEHTIKLTAASVALNCSSVELRGAYDNNDHYEDPDLFSKLIRNYSRALNAVTDVIGDLIDTAGRLLDEE